MFVRKFEADSLEEALREIKRELGPDAIILKTTTNKGIKGAFKKNRIEITAAISEKNYTKKARVDHALDQDHKEKFYQNGSSFISEMIDNHSDNKPYADQGRYQVKKTGYDSIGLNKSVQTVKNLSEKVRSGLDDFLSGGVGEMLEVPSRSQVLNQRPVQLEIPSDNRFMDSPDAFVGDKLKARYVEKDNLDTEDQNREVYEQRIDELEKKIFELTKSVRSFERKEPTGIYHLRTTLKSLGIEDSIINELIKKSLFHLGENETQDIEQVFEYALREMLNQIQVDMPLFSRVNQQDQGTVTLLVSDGNCGQTTFLYKLGSLIKDVNLIQYHPDQVKFFTESILNLNINKYEKISELSSEIRKTVERGSSCLVDYRNKSKDMEDTKKFIEGLKRSFGQVEVLICLSGIHSEAYNRRIISKYQRFASGLVVSHLDYCMNYGSLFNICHDYQELPLVFFGTGETVPEDMESATGERILAGMFKLS